jgi:hypothetical protein
MKSTDNTLFVPGVVSVLATLNALFLFGNGLAMLLIPRSWYHAVPGVSHTGPFNPHFVQDIGLIQMFMGGLLGLGLIHTASRHVLWAAATIWLSAHAILHFWEVAVGICPPSALARDFAAVTLPALIGIALTWWSRRTGGRPGRRLEFA